MIENNHNRDTLEQTDPFNLSALFDNAIEGLVPPDLLSVIADNKQSIIDEVLKKIKLALKYTAELNATGVSNLLESAIKDWIEKKQKDQYYEAYKQTMISQKFEYLTVTELEKRNYNRQYRLWNLWVLIIKKNIKVGSKVMLTNPRGTGKTWMVQSVTSDCQLNFRGSDKGKKNPRNYELAE
ncbi:MAG: hypothetical protein WC862_02465 [Patescibacteria group bacterium]